MKIRALLFFLFSCSLVYSQLSEERSLCMRFPYALSRVSAGDMDNDGLVDLVFAFSENISWSKNIDGGTTWSANQPIDMEGGGSEGIIRLADLNGDGLLDIVKCYKRYPYLSLVWYRNEGEGKFTERIIIDDVQNGGSGGSDRLSLACGDVDNDGDIDLVVSYKTTNDTYHRVMFYKNETGLGDFSNTFIASSAIPEPNFVNLAHMNDDNLLDIVFLSDKDSLMLAENLGEGVFAPPVSILAPPSKIQFYNIGDVDGDGDSDILYITTISSSYRGVWSENIDNQGTFSPSPQLFAGVPTGLLFIDLADVDGDTLPDIVFFRSFGDIHVGFMKNLGSYEYSTVPSSIYDLGSQHVAANYERASIITYMDYDGDGDMDMAFPPKYLFFENTGEGEFDVSRRIQMGLYFMSKYSFADIDGDGYYDIVGDGGDDFYPLAWLRYNPSVDLWEAPRQINVSGYGFPNTRMALFTFDINGDGYEDILYKSENHIRWLLNDGTGQFTELQQVESCPPLVHGIYAEDMDNDGFKDIVIGPHPIYKEKIYWHKNMNGEGFAPCEVLYSGTQLIKSIQILDFDQDGFLDILPLFEDSSNPQAGWIQNRGTFASPGNLFHLWKNLVTNTFNSQIGSIAYSAPNEDGLRDIFIANAGNNYARVFKQLEPSVFAPPTSLFISSVVSRLFTFDYDADGLEDLIYSPRYTQKYYWKKKHQDGSYGPDLQIPLGDGNISGLSLFDLDKDGDQDFIYFRESRLNCRYNLIANAKIIARAFYDANENGILDSTENLLSRFTFQILPDDISYFTSFSNTATFFLPEGTYTLNSIPEPGWGATSPESQVVAFSHDTIIYKDFGYYPDTLFKEISCDLTSAPTRCGFTVPFWLTYTNTGTMPVQEFALKLHAPEPMPAFLSSAPPPDTILNDTLYWYISDLQPFQSRMIAMNFQIPGVDFLGSTIAITTSAVEEDSIGDAHVLDTHVFESIISCAYDPNDKLVYPAGFLNEQYTLFEDYLEFTVRFQNTGTDTAFNVLITDSLDPNFDWTTFRLLASSHVVEASLDSQTGLAQFYFPNILLPDSTTNERESHGFVKYKILSKQGLQEGTPVQNTANIFFDFNPPIITNTTLNTLVSEYPIEVSSILNNPLCHDDSTGTISLNVYAVPPISYNWSNGNDFSNTNMELPSGIHHVTITDGAGGTKIDSFSLSNPPLLSVQLTSTPQLGEVLGTATALVQGGTPPYTIQWDSDPVQFGSVATGLAEGTYRADIRDVNLCSLSDTVIVPLLVSSQDFISSTHFNIYPNPTAGTVLVEVKIDSPTNEFGIVISDAYGRIVYTNYMKYHGASTTLPIETKNFGAGIYFICLTHNQTVLCDKLIVVPD